jgi:hypothetical protein
MYGVKWRDFKLVLVAQKYMNDAGQRLATPHIINLITDPQEREPVSLPHLHTWTVTHFNRIIAEYPSQPPGRAPHTRRGLPRAHRDAAGLAFPGQAITGHEVQADTTDLAGQRLLARNSRSWEPTGAL